MYSCLRVCVSACLQISCVRVCESHVCVYANLMSACLRVSCLRVCESHVCVSACLPSGESREQLISPCRCAGSVGLVHVSCIEKWLSAANKDSCEICMYRYVTERRPKPLLEVGGRCWISDPSGVTVALTGRLVVVLKACMQ